MEKSNKGLIVGGVILVAVLIISITFFIYKGGFGMATNNMQKYTTEQVEAFNAQFEMYIGQKSGKSLSELITKITVLANQNKDDLERIPKVTIKNNYINKEKDKIESLDTPTDPKDSLQKYVKALSVIKQKIEDNHTYTIGVSYDEDGCINEFIFSY